MNQAHIPVVMSVVGDQFTDSCRISAIIWEGQTSVNDICEIHTLVGDYRLWKGRANDTSTYLGVGWGYPGIPCDGGFKLVALGAGTVAVYILER